jgi:peptide/nickel transport system substrate-binding protein
LKPVIAVLTVLLSAPAAFAQSAPGGTLVYGTAAGPATLDPYAAGGTADWEIAAHIFEGLVGLDEQFNPKPMLAASIDTSADAKTYTFTLRKGVTFQNGKPMTATDVIASFRRYQKVSPNAIILDGVESYDSTGPTSFIVHLKQPNAVFINMLATPLYPLAILPAEEESKPAREADIIGTGPFRLGDWLRDDHLDLQRFDGYAADDRETGLDGLVGHKTALVDRVRVRFLPETNARIAALRSGSVDLISTISPDTAKGLQADPKVVVMSVFPGTQAMLVLNSRNGPTANVLIRQAIEAVVDAHEIVAATGQLARFNPAMLYATSPYYDVPSNQGHYDLHDVALARQKLHEAGYTNERIVLQTNASYGFMRDAILVLAEEMKTAGMNADVDMVDWTTNSNNMQRGTGNWNVSTTGFSPAPLLGPQQWRNQVYNFAQIKDDAALDDAYRRFFTQLDPAGRKQAWADIQQDVYGKAYFIKIADYGFMSARKADLKGYSPWIISRFFGVSAP